MTTCEFILVPCPKECRDESNAVKHFIRKCIKEHLESECVYRDWKCKYCGEKNTYTFITQVHDMDCLEKIVLCPNAGCGFTVERRQLKEHLNAECIYAAISCKYKGVGCSMELTREKMAAHEQDDKLHLHMVLEAVISLRATVSSLQVKVDSQEEQLKLLKNEEAATPSRFQLKARGKAGTSLHGKCTFNTYQRGRAQEWYKCSTCWGPDSSFGCCLPCASSCHSDHLLTKQYGPFSCNCAKNEHRPSVCTRHGSGTSFKVQPYYRCLTCFTRDNVGVCYQCSLNCHLGHKVVYAGPMRAFCDCGLESCQATCRIPKPT